MDVNVKLSINSQEQNNLKAINDTELKNPLLVKNVALNPDWYVLTWSALRDDIWEEKEDFRGQHIYPTEGNIFWLQIEFVLFVFLVTLTISVLMIEVFTTDLFHPASWPIYILRLTLVTFAQKKIEPEFYHGFVMYRYTLQNSENFSNFKFALFIPICKLFIAFITFTSIIFYICMANTALDLIMNFA